MKVIQITYYPYHKLVYDYPKTSTKRLVNNKYTGKTKEL